MDQSPGSTSRAYSGGVVISIHTGVKCHGTSVPLTISPMYISAPFHGSLADTSKEEKKVPTGSVHSTGQQQITSRGVATTKISRLIEARFFHPSRDQAAKSSRAKKPTVSTGMMTPATREAMSTAQASAWSSARVGVRRSRYSSMVKVLAA